MGWNVPSRHAISCGVIQQTRTENASRHKLERIISFAISTVSWAEDPASCGTSDLAGAGPVPEFEDIDCRPPRVSASLSSTQIVASTELAEQSVHILASFALIRSF